jgi:hypothetical protein
MPGVTPSAPPRIVVVVLGAPGRAIPPRPQVAPVPTSPDGPRRTPPVPALLAAPLALVTALAVGFFSVLAVAFSNGQFDDGGWLVVVLPTVLAVGLVLGVILLLLGRSWLVLTVLAGALAAVLLGGELIGTWDTGTVGPVAALFPAGAAVLAALPGVRHWVAVRRAGRTRG